MHFPHGHGLGFSVRLPHLEHSNTIAGPLLSVATSHECRSIGRRPSPPVDRPGLGGGGPSLTGAARIMAATRYGDALPRSTLAWSAAAFQISSVARLYCAPSMSCSQ